MAELLQPVTGVRCLNKPRSEDGRQIGMWTSTYLGDERISGWVQWCLIESFDGPDFNVWLLDPDPDAIVYEVNDAADLDALVAKYGAEPEHSFRSGLFPYLDFDAFAADGYSGVHLTDDGQWATRHRREYDEWSLYGWDCECTLWVRWPFRSVMALGTITARGIQ